MDSQQKRVADTCLHRGILEMTRLFHNMTPEQLNFLDNDDTMEKYEEMIKKGCQNNSAYYLEDIREHLKKEFWIDSKPPPTPDQEA